MESLESKLDRLTPEQRREIEDFVDFLLHRNEPVPAAQNVTVQAPPFLKAVPPPLTASEPQESQPATAGEPTRRIVIRQPAPMDVADEEPEPVLQEIGSDDPVTGEYLDYGRFEETPSPASAAVKRVKEKIIPVRTPGKKNRSLNGSIDLFLKPAVGRCPGREFSRTFANARTFECVWHESRFFYLNCCSA